MSPVPDLDGEGSQVGRLTEDDPTWWLLREALIYVTAAAKIRNDPAAERLAIQIEHALWPPLTEPTRETR